MSSDAEEQPTRKDADNAWRNSSIAAQGTEGGKSRRRRRRNNNSRNKKKRKTKGSKRRNKKKSRRLGRRGVWNVPHQGNKGKLIYTKGKKKILKKGGMDTRNWTAGGLSETEIKNILLQSDIIANTGKGLPIYSKDGLVYKPFVKVCFGQEDALKEHKLQDELYKKVSEECKKYICKPISFLEGTTYNFWIYCSLFSVGSCWSSLVRHQQMEKSPRKKYVNGSPPNVLDDTEVSELEFDPNYGDSTEFINKNGSVAVYNDDDEYKGVYLHSTRCNFTIQEHAKYGENENMMASTRSKLPPNVDRSNLKDLMQNGITCLHNNNVAHCDLHDGNIIVLYEGNTIQAVKFIDFGKSKDLSKVSSQEAELLKKKDIQKIFPK